MVLNLSGEENKEEEKERSPSPKPKRKKRRLKKLKRGKAVEETPKEEIVEQIPQPENPKPIEDDTELDIDLNAIPNEDGVFQADEDEDDDIKDDAHDPKNLADQDPDFDENEVNNEEIVEPMNDEMVERIEQEAEMNRKAREYMEKLEGRKPRRGNISTSALVVKFQLILL